MMNDKIGRNVLYKNQYFVNGISHGVVTIVNISVKCTYAPNPFNKFPIGKHLSLGHNRHIIILLIEQAVP